MHFLFIFPLYISLINVNTLKKDASLLSSDRRKQGIRNKRSFAYNEVPHHRAFSMWVDKKKAVASTIACNCLSYFVKLITYFSSLLLTEMHLFVDYYNLSKCDS